MTCPKCNDKGYTINHRDHLTACTCPLGKAWIKLFGKRDKESSNEQP